MMLNVHKKLIQNERSVSCVEGVRGIASIFVILSHMTAYFAEYVEYPAVNKNGPIRLFQRPFLRLVGEGQTFVAIFFVLLGFVNSVNVIRLSNSGDFQKALTTLATSAFHRTGRLVLPSAFATILAWSLCQLGAFQAARTFDAGWWFRKTPQPSRTWSLAVVDLGAEIMSTWFYGQNRYDPHQWTLMYLLQGSYFTYMTLLATVFVRPSFRLSVKVILYIWGWTTGYCLVRMNIFAGMILAEVVCLPHFPGSEKSPMNSWLSYACASLGLFLGSFPRSNADFALWSRQLHFLGTQIFPAVAIQSRYWQGIGAQLICTAVMFSPSMRCALSNRYLAWLGRASFSLYLLHGTLMRSALAWMLFIFPGTTQPLSPLLPISEHENQKHRDIRGFAPDRPIPVFIMISFLLLLLVVVKLWMSTVDSWVGKIIVKLEALAKSSKLE